TQTRNLELGTWNSELGTWNSELGTQNSELSFDNERSSATTGPARNEASHLLRRSCRLYSQSLCSKKTRSCAAGGSCDAGAVGREEDRRRLDQLGSQWARSAFPRQRPRFGKDARVSRERGAQDGK